MIELLFTTVEYPYDFLSKCVSFRQIKSTRIFSFIHRYIVSEISHTSSIQSIKINAQHQCQTSIDSMIDIGILIVSFYEIKRLLISRQTVRIVATKKTTLCFMVSESDTRRFKDHVIVHRRADCCSNQMQFPDFLAPQER